MAPRDRAALWVVGAATLVVLAAFTTVMTTVGDTVATFVPSPAWQTWALGGMSLGLAGALLTAGTVADIVGRRGVFVWANIVLAGASLLAALAPSMLVFVVARVLQGAAGAGVLAAGLGLLGQLFPPGSARTHATGIWGATLAAGIAVGPVLGAVSTALTSWRLAHGIDAVVALAMAVVGRSLPRPTGQVGRRSLDPLGAVTMFVAMSFLTAGITAGRTSWTSPPTGALFVAGLLALGAFGWVESRRSDPMLDLSLLRNPRFLVSVVGAAVTGLASVGLMTYVPTVVQRGLGDGGLAGGWLLALWALVSMVIATGARWLPAGLPAHARLTAGLAVSALGSTAIAWLGVGSSWVTLVPGLVVAGVGSGLANAALAHLAVESVPDGDASLGSGANNTARYVGSALGIACVAAILAAGGADRPGLLHGWNHAALASAGLNLFGAASVIVLGRRHERHDVTSRVS